MPNLNITKPELIWPGKYDDNGKRIVNRGAALPFQIIETIRDGRATRESGGPDLFAFADQKNEPDIPDKWHNKLIWGDNLLVMSSLLQQYAGKIDLIYIDPPFATGSDFSFTTRIGEGEEVIEKGQSAMEEKAYRDTWGNGVDSYLTMMASRVPLIRELLTPTGVLFLHCDWHMSHLLRCLLDDIFGSQNFLNELVWQRTGAHNDAGRFGVVHDVLLFYSKSETHTFNPVFIPHSDEHLATRFNQIEPKTGKRFFAGPITAPGSGPARKFKGKLLSPPPGRHWSYDQEGIDLLEQKKMIYYSRTGTPYLKQYMEEYVAQGRRVQSIWTDLLPGKTGAEILGYPTQKPEGLLERVVQSASNEGDLVADFFCGSGTTLAVAEKLGRRWIGVDLGRFAIHTTRKRLLGIPDCKPFQLLNLGQYERKHWQGVTFGKPSDEPEAVLIAEYIRFILDLYQAQSCSGFRHIHGRKGKALIAVGAVDAPVTITQVNEAVSECASAGMKELHILGWEWEMGMNDPIVKQAKAAHGVILRLLTIPREVMEKRAVECGDIRFFDVAYLKAEIIPHDKNKHKVKIELKNFAIPDTELIPEEVRQKITKWSDYIDYWAVDWDYQRDTFMNQWQTYRTRTDRKLALVSAEHEYPDAGKYEILVKVVDIFGNDTSLLLEWKVK